MIAQALPNALEQHFGLTNAARTGATSKPAPTAIDVVAANHYTRIHALMPALSTAPYRALELRKGLSTIDLRWKPAENEHSIIEHLCHLRDIEKERHGIRICRLLAEDQPWLVAVYSDALEGNRRYREQHPLAVINDFFQARQVNIVRIRGASPAQLLRQGCLMHVGPVRIIDVVHMMIKHDQEHLRVISGLREMLLTL
jgi:hypothetical protein